ncbi:glutathione S-transferase C-terminal domain-containing protein isoform X2 [Lepisosteus oculatus]|uniref:glutathione S-transferase C-terminal domain-containing protein isoform X2 n=1 Tax=Lepisosteus oculatus TaxID=7918 RepID=UPI0035F50A63
MKHTNSKRGEECLYLDISDQSEEAILPLHTSITLFLLSYCDSKLFRVFLVPSRPDPAQSWRHRVPGGLAASVVSEQDLPALVRSCCLPAVLEEEGRYCRAGLAVVLRHIIQRTCEEDPSRKDVAALLGFKKTCLKACAEVSQWTRLCELNIPSAVEEFLRQPAGPDPEIPAAILRLEKKLEEPVKVHNDDKIRRQKLQQQKEEAGSATQPASFRESVNSEELELRAALAKLSVEDTPLSATRGPSNIRRVKTTELPALEHVFAEGLYFTLTDLVLLPCLHHFLVSLHHRESNKLARLPLLQRWYRRVQEVPGVARAAGTCGIGFLLLPDSGWHPALESRELCPPEQEPAEKAQAPFIGGPRPTMTKLRECGIEAVFTPHPCPSWTLDWNSLPTAVNPTEGKMSDVRALRKQQQLNNLVAMVTKAAQPGDTVVDFCSGGGHVGIVLAHTLPECQVLLIENKEESLVRAKNRCRELGLNNIGFIQANLDYFTGPFQVGIQSFSMFLPFVYVVTSFFTLAVMLETLWSLFFLHFYFSDSLFPADIFKCSICLYCFCSLFLRTAFGPNLNRSPSIADYKPSIWCLVSFQKRQEADSKHKAVIKYCVYNWHFRDGSTF